MLSGNVASGLFPLSCEHLDVYTMRGYMHGGERLLRSCAWEPLPRGMWWYPYKKSS